MSFELNLDTSKTFNIWKLIIIIWIQGSCLSIQDIIRNLTIDVKWLNTNLWIGNFHWPICNLHYTMFLHFLVDNLHRNLSDGFHNWPYLITKWKYISSFAWFLLQSLMICTNMTTVFQSILGHRFLWRVLPKSDMVYRISFDFLKWRSSGPQKLRKLRF